MSSSNPTKITPTLGSTLGASKPSLFPFSSKLSTAKSSTVLDPDKFEALMTRSLTYSDNPATFHTISSTLIELLGVEIACLWIVNESEHQLYTYQQAGADNGGDVAQIYKPMERGMAGAVVTTGEGVMQRGDDWDDAVDDIPDFVTTSFLLWPLKGSGNQIVGLLECRNKLAFSKAGKTAGTFSQADLQLVRIFASQVTMAIQEFRREQVLEGRNGDLAKAYMTDKTDAIKMTTSEDVTLLDGDAGMPVTGGGGEIEFASASLGVTIETTRGQLQRWEYNVFSHTADELIMLFVDVFEDRGLFSRFLIDIKVFLSFTRTVMAGYSTVTPYHNFYHGFDVMHVCYLIVSTGGADGYLEDFNILSLLVGAIAHDVGHDGYNNAFHAGTMSDLAVTYNGICIMESYSAAFLFRILKREDCDILERIGKEDQKKLRGRLIDMILDTDAKNHFILMTRFKHGLEMKQLSRGLLSSMILHIADVSNPTRPGPVSRQWAFAVQEEFFRQGDKEKELGIAVSPFMDREQENLPRMQGAFIDALVSPAFHLVAEFLPKITVVCIKSMQVNRAFWNNLQIKKVLTTPDIKEYLSGNKYVDTEDKDDEGAADSTPSAAPPPTASSFKFGSSSAYIPGIPINAPHSPGSSKRKMSVIDMSNAREEAAAVAGAIEGEEGDFGASELMSPRNLEKKKREEREKRKQRTAEMLDGNGIQLFMLVCTAYALVADDMSIWVGSKDNDAALSAITFVVLVAFTVEMCISIYCVPEYMQFFFYLDFVAALSLVPEVEFLVGEDTISIAGDSAGPSIEDQGTLTRAGRAAKAGARAGRIARVLRLIRLVRIIKLIKWVATYVRKASKKEEEEAEKGEEVEMKMSNVGRTMTESITRKVILAVMFMLLTFSIFNGVSVPDAREKQLEDLAYFKLGNTTANFTVMNNLKERYIRQYSTCFALLGVGDKNWYKVEDLSQNEGGEGTFEHKTLRALEQEIVRSTLDPSISAYFDISEETQNTAMQSFVMTCVVTVLLAVLSMLFSRDAYDIMIRPIEKMKHTVQQLSENPLLHLKKLDAEKGQAVNHESETDMLEQAITKMARLLQIGFGAAGAEIIAKNLGDGGELNPMIAGSKIEGIFGFCDIRDFTFATEGLQEDVMLFVNKVAEITHRYVVESGGAPNKNIGDAFLLVWKLSEGGGPRGGGDLQKELFDAALVSFLKIIRDIRKMSTLSAFLEGADENAAWRSSLEDFKVAMGFGLHTGWAIEGSIGSKVKVDASYLSPHVNLASRLEAATKQFNVPLLMSEAFAKGLTGSTQSNCRRVDSVIFKGSSEPMHIFHYDCEAFETLKERPKKVDDLLKKCAWVDSDAQAADINLDEFKSLFNNNKEHIVRQVYEMGFLAYVDGKWDKSRIILAMWLDKFPADPLGFYLLERLYNSNFKAPQGWAGHHSLTEK